MTVTKEDGELENKLVPMEIVNELLGHSNMSITHEYYGKVVMK